MAPSAGRRVSRVKGKSWILEGKVLSSFSPSGLETEADLRTKAVGQKNVTVGFPFSIVRDLRNLEWVSPGLL